jgi:hypothetical protein
MPITLGWSSSIYKENSYLESRVMCEKWTYYAPNLFNEASFSNNFHQKISWLFGSQLFLYPLFTYLYHPYFFVCWWCVWPFLNGARSTLKYNIWITLKIISDQNCNICWSRSFAHDLSFSTTIEWTILRVWGRLSCSPHKHPNCKTQSVSAVSSIQLRCL